MASSGMLRRAALVGTDVSDERSASETSVLTRATQRNIPEDTILHSSDPYALTSVLTSHILLPVQHQVTYIERGQWGLESHKT
jgi:hypothetical protein